MLSALSSRWWALLLRGICAITAGIIAIMVPNLALVSLVALFAAFALADGLASVIIGVRGEPDGAYWWTMILFGVIAIAAGIVACFYPGMVLAVLLGFVAWMAIFRGAVEIVAAVRLRKLIEDEWLLGLSGAISIVFGVLLLSRPAVSLIVLAMLFGAFMLTTGAVAVALSLRLRKVHQRLIAGAPAHVA